MFTSELMLIRLFQHPTRDGGQPLASVFRKVRGATYLVVGCGLVVGSEAEECLERDHGEPPAIMAKDEFIEVDLELITAHAVVGSDQPLLEVANCTVRQWHHRLRAFAAVGSEELVPGHVFEPSFVEPGEALETVGVQR